MSMIKNFDWPAFISQHDMHFSALPRGWQEAPHFGNAMIGSMLYVDDDQLTLEIFRADVRDHRDERYGWTAYRAPHFRIGKFKLHTKGKPIACQWTKSIWNADLSGTITTDRGIIGIHHFTHSEEMAIITELTGSPGESECYWSWHPFEAHTTRGGYPSDEMSKEAFARRYGKHYLETIKPPVDNPPGRLEMHDETSLWIQDLWAGGQYATAWTERHQNKTDSLLVTITNTFPETTAANEALANIERFTQTETTAWRKAHRHWWHTYYPQSYVSIPDKELETLYWQTIYRMGCCSRAGRYYVDTSGLWFQGAQWPYTTNDWNTQAAHWGVYAANRLDQGEEICNRLHAGIENMIAAVWPEAWQNDSAYLNLATSCDMAGTRRSDMRYYNLVGCLPWLLHNAWWQYRFSMNEDLLRKTIYPLLRRAVNLYLHLSHGQADGSIHLEPTYSPETDEYRNANFDLALFKWGCHTLLKACSRLNIDDPLIPRWQEVTARLVDFPADEQGYMLGSEQTCWLHHRHLSHLLMIYPLYLANIEQDDTIDVLKRSYQAIQAGNGSDDGAIEELVAMVQAHAGPIGAALVCGDEVLSGLRKLQRELSPTGLWSCSNNACTESTLCIANNIQNMLIQRSSDPAQEQPGPIRIFPALPANWMDVEFHNLRAEGAFLVSANRKAGITEWIRIQSLAGEPCRIKTGMKKFDIHGGQHHTLSPDGILEVILKPGETVNITMRCHAGKGMP